MLSERLPSSARRAIASASARHSSPRVANVLTGQFVGFQSALGVEPADYKIICEPAGTGAEAGGHFETGPVVPWSLQQGAY